MTTTTGIEIEVKLSSNRKLVLLAIDGEVYPLLSEDAALMARKLIECSNETLHANTRWYCEGCGAEYALERPSRCDRCSTGVIKAV